MKCKVKISDFIFTKSMKFYSECNPSTNFFLRSENQVNPKIHRIPFTKINPVTRATVLNDASELVDKNAGSVATTDVMKPIKTPVKRRIKYSEVMILKIGWLLKPMACITEISRRRSKSVRAKITANPMVPRIKPNAPNIQLANNMLGTALDNNDISAIDFLLNIVEVWTTHQNI